MSQEKHKSEDKYTFDGKGRLQAVGSISERELFQAGGPSKLAKQEEMRVKAASSLSSSSSSSINATKNERRREKNRKSSFITEKANKSHVSTLKKATEFIDTASDSDLIRGALYDSKVEDAHRKMRQMQKYKDEKRSNSK